MLIGFSVENYKSFFGDTTLSMTATADKEHLEFNVIHTEHGNLLKNALVYGANASGKSNLIDALYYMKKMISSAFDVQTEYIKYCHTFTFSDVAKSKPTKFELSFLLDGVMYEYGFDVLNKQITREYLYNKAKRRTLVFERTGPEYTSIRTRPAMSDVESLKKNVRGDVLFLTWAAYANNALAIKIVDWITNNLIIILSNRNISPSSPYTTVSLPLLKKADNFLLGMSIPRDRKLRAIYPIFDEKWMPIDEIDVSFENYASDGTKNILGLSAVFDGNNEDCKTIVIDEMDLHLHPALVRHLIAQINSIEHNRNNTQLICTTHDVLLLDEDIRRDQIWFVDKNKHGVSALYALSDFKDVRKNSDILKRYLLGVYGAIPDLNWGDGDA
ncbi:MAG: ATP-binding protein [Oscillospiraceae bacterium]|nr:ATP-binding protein [Oscillospiraceae bacterium]MCL2279826.1 ATP-binding protein [Oscillospiraceae bacterium]